MLKPINLSSVLKDTLWQFEYKWGINAISVRIILATESVINDRIDLILRPIDQQLSVDLFDDTVLREITFV